MSTAFTVILALHGLAHLIGFAGTWQVGEPGRVLHKASVFGGRYRLSGPQLRMAGMLWLLCALAFVAAAVLQITFWSALAGAATAGIAALSALLCLAFLPEARIGLGVNVLIIVALLVRQQ